MLTIAPVPRLWPGATIVCLGSGPSLCADDLTWLRKARARTTGQVRVVAVNDTYKVAPWADVLYAPDARWWGWQGRLAQNFAGLKFTIQQDTDDPERAGAQLLNYRSGGGLSDDPATVCTGGHGGFQAINLAAHLGARRIALLGYDMQPSDAGAHHYFGEHPDQSHVPYDTWRDIYATLVAPAAARNITIVNCSRRTAIAALPRMTLQEFLHESTSG